MKLSADRLASSNVSAVLPLHNRVQLIGAALDSIAGQTAPVREIVVVDDGSTDGSADAAARWAERHPQITLRLVRQENAGANRARNRGIEEAHGEYIAFLDSDDQWLPDKIEKQLALMEENPQTGGVYCGARNLDLETGNLETRLPRVYPQGDLLRQMLVGDVTAPTSCWLVRRSCFGTVGTFDESLPARQDWDMWIRVSARYPIAAATEPLVLMGEHAGERVRSNEDREIVAHLAIFKKYSYLRAGEPLWVSLAARSAMYRRRGRMCLHKKGDRLKAVGLQLLAIGTWPLAFDSYAALIGAVLPSGARQVLHRAWNRVFGKTPIRIRSH